jgi:hypothetical protein
MQTTTIQRASLVLRLLATATAAISLTACNASILQKQDDESFSGLMALNMGASQPVAADQALQELARYCDQSTIGQFVASVAGTLSFTAGYNSAMEAGWDGQVVRGTGPNGRDGFWLGEGDMGSSGGLAMFAPHGQSIDELVAGYCRVTMNTLRHDGSTRCAYDTATMARGSLSGVASRGQVQAGDCLIAQMSSQSAGTRTEIAFCQGALGANLFQQGIAGITNQMSIVLRGSGAGAAPAPQSSNIAGMSPGQGGYASGPGATYGDPQYSGGAPASSQGIVSGGINGGMNAGMQGEPVMGAGEPVEEAGMALN